MERGYHGRERKNNRAAEKKWLQGYEAAAHADRYYFGAISRKNMYRISDKGCKMEYMIELEDGTVLDLPEDKWTAVIKSGLDVCGFSGGQNVRNITLKEA